MNIRQIDSPVICGAERVGKWYCSDSAMGPDKHPVYRYLQADGTWGKNSHYFDTKAALQVALAKGNKPDFTTDRQELDDRQIIRDVSAVEWNEPWD